MEYIHANGLPFIEGCIIKYATRHKTKGGAEDIRKVIHFAKILLELDKFQHIRHIECVEPLSHSSGGEPARPPPETDAQPGCPMERTLS